MARPALRRVVILSVLTLACRGAPMSDLSLADGRRLGALGEGGLPTDGVVLVLNPADCSTCTAWLQEWIAERRAKPQSTWVVLTRPPDGPEQQQLRLARIEPDALLARRQDIETPIAVVFRNGVVVGREPFGAHQVRPRFLTWSVAGRGVELPETVSDPPHEH